VKGRKFTELLTIKQEEWESVLLLVVLRHSFFHHHFSYSGRPQDDLIYYLLARLPFIYDNHNETMFALFHHSSIRTLDIVRWSSY